MVITENLKNTQIRFSNVDDYEKDNNSIDEWYDSQDAVFRGWIYKINTLQFRRVRRPPFGNGCDFKHAILENCGNICFIPTKGYCFIKCNKFLTGSDYKKWLFIWSEDRSSNIITRALNQSNIKRWGINLE